MSFVLFACGFLSHLSTGTYRTAKSEDQTILRVFRAFRVLKLAKYNPQSVLFARTIEASFPALKFFVFLTTIVVVISGTIIYCCEKGKFKVTPEHPEGAHYRPKIGGGEEVSPFHGIFFGMYWVSQ